LAVSPYLRLAEAHGSPELERRFSRADPELSPSRPSSAAGSDALLREYQLSHAPHLLDQIVQDNDGLLHHVLKRFANAGESYDDMYQVARLGMVKAVQRFDPRRGTAFSTYAVAIVDGEVRHHLRDCLLVREPRWARSLYAHIQEAQDAFYKKNGRFPTIAELAAAVNVQEEGVLEIIRYYGAINLHSLDEPFADAGEAELDRTVVRSLRQEPFSLPIEERIMVHEALQTLSDLHRRIIYGLFFRDLTQQQVADEEGLSQRTVSREQNKALSRLKSVMGTRIF
jgi:RNA polymerase sigma-B factor